MCCFFCVTDNSSKEEDIGYFESEQLNLVVIRAATNNFSEENKLGEGGFGEVFKVHFHLYIYHIMWCYKILGTFSHDALLS
jgi:hypothetical protein